MIRVLHTDDCRMGVAWHLPSESVEERRPLPAIEADGLARLTPPVPLFVPYGAFYEMERM